MKAANKKGWATTVGKYLRVIILIAVLAGTVGLAQNQVAWAQPAAESVESVQVEVTPLALPSGHHDDDDGTVKPPPDRVKICKRGTFSVGGVATIKVKRLDRHYCVIAVLVRRNHMSKGTSTGGGQILADITLFQVTYKGHFVKSLPTNAGHVEICYAVPPGKKAKIYYLDFEERAWKPLPTTVHKRTACARIKASSAYALIGK